MNSDTYHAFMLDYATGALCPDMALAAQLHILLSDEGKRAADTWASAGAVFGMEANRDSDRLPEALELANGDLQTVPWKRGLSGAHYARRGKGNGQLMRLDPGQTVPAHNHTALEATVVLEGEFEDGHGVYRRGDLVLGPPGMRHQPAAHGEHRCVCFVAKEPIPFWRFS